MSREQLFAAFFFTVFLYLLYQFYLVFHYFLGPLTWAAIVALIFYPAYRRLCALLRQRAGLAALLLTLTVNLVVFIPLIYLTALVASESAAAYQQVRDIIASGHMPDLAAQLRGTAIGRLYDRVLPLLAEWKVDLPDLLLKSTNVISAFLVAQASVAAANVLRFLADFFFSTFALFFFLRDGERMVRGLRDLLPMEAEHKDAILGRLYDTVSAVVQGSLATALAQGILAGIIYAILGVPFALLLSCATAFLSLLPIGAPIVWLSVVVYFATQAAYVKAAVLLVYGVVVISSADNVIRPLIIGERAQIPTVFLFFGILGGLQTYGLAGAFVGPVLIAILVAFIRIYREEYATS